MYRFADAELEPVATKGKTATRDALHRAPGPANTPPADPPAEPALDVVITAPVEPTVDPLLAEPVVEAARSHLQHGVLHWQRQLVLVLVGLDMLAATLAALLAVTLRFGDSPSNAYRLASVILPVVWVAACAVSRAYEPRFLGSGSEEYRRVFDAGVRLLAGTALVALALKVDLARLYVLVAFPSVVILCLAFRYAARQYVHRRRARGGCLHRVLVVGRERSCAELTRQLHREPHAGFSVVGACIDRSQDSSVEGVPVVGTSRSIMDALAETGADTVAVGAWSDLSQTDLRRLSWQLEGTRVALVVAPSLTDVAGPRIHIRPVAGLPLLHVEQPEFTGGRRLLKGTVDRVSSICLLLVLTPLLLAIAIAVRLTSPGPALFRQVRVGHGGEAFTLYKFRTMYVDSEAQLATLAGSNEASDGLLFKMRDDPRITPLGRWLRRFSLDELPQLLNIVKSDMSVVGPRPPLPQEVAQYGDDVRRRLLVKPGLTGLWQVSGRSDLSWDESVRLDLHYVENWSLALDAMIVWKTIFAVLGRRGAY
jgi:exopolysaccharide biosynthesis polyprenyl glycosylphosphotransferase